MSTNPFDDQEESPFTLTSTNPFDDVPNNQEKPPTLPSTNPFDEDSSDLGEPPSTIPNESRPSTPDEFLETFRTQASECTQNVYLTDRPISESSSGTLTSSLAEDLAYLIGVQIDVLDEYIISSELSASEKEDLRAEAVFSILHALYCKQLVHRNRFLTDLDGCCSAANDFYRLMERTDELLSALDRKHPSLRLLGCGESSGHAREVADLLQLYATDAVCAAELVHRFVFESVDRSSIGSDLFGEDWEERMTKNEVALSLVRTVEDYMLEVEGYLDSDIMYRKAVDVLVRGTVAFYIRCLIRKTERVRQSRSCTTTRKRIPKTRNMDSAGEDDGCLPFLDPVTAVDRLGDDVYEMKSFFKSYVLQMPALDPLIEREFAVLVAVHICLRAATQGAEVAEEKNGILESVSLLHARSGGDLGVTRRFISDLWYLVVPYGDESLALPPLVEDELQKLASDERIQDDGNSKEHHVFERDRVLAIGLEHDLISNVLTETYGNDQWLRPHVASQTPILPSNKGEAGRKAATKTMRQRLKTRKVKVPKVSMPTSRVKKGASNFAKTCRRAAHLT